MDKPTLKDLLRNHVDDLPALDLGPVKSVFGDGELPEIDESQVGKIRLHQALAKKYGPTYKSVPAVRNALKHYEKEVAHIQHYKKILGARYGR
jgi:hypothetical protein